MNPYLARLVIFLLPGCGLAGAAPLAVRVDAAAGAPRLMVNGKPVRARMFWGAPGSAPLKIGPQAQALSYEFVAGAGASNATMHFRFGAQPGVVVLDDIRAVDLTDGGELLPRCSFDDGADAFTREWDIWPPGKRNTTGTVSIAAGEGRDSSAGLRVSLTAAPDGVWPDFHIYHQANLAIVEGHRYRVELWAKADPARSLITALYRPGATYVQLGGPAGLFESQIKLAADAGVNFVSFPIATPWPEPGVAEDWTGVDEECARVLRANPNALLLPRIGMDPPAWWGAAHPDDIMRWEDGPHRAVACVASPVYRQDAAERLAALVRHLEAKFGEHVAGYHPVGQNTGEWFYEDTWNHPLNGYAAADLTAWRLWLKAAYGNDAALQSAWHNAETIATASVPTPAQRHATPDGPLHDPEKSRRLIDWARFQQATMADCVTGLAHAARQASGGRKLVVFFYGYVFEFAPVATGAAVSGHYALRRLLDCPDIDVLCSPISYFDRGLGESAPSMTAAESVALAGKLWLNEDDTHTYLATGTQPGSQQHAATLEETNAELLRNVAQESLRNFGSWWMDLGASGWFNDPALWAQMARLKELDEELLRQPTPFHPEIAAVIDEQAMLRVAEGASAVTRSGMQDARRMLGRLGAPYGQYLLDDVVAGRVQAKIYLMLNPWNLGEPERARLMAATQGARWIWLDAAGAKPALTSMSLRQAAHEAGAHVFTRADCNVWANGPFVSLHASQDGPVEIDTGRADEVRDALNGERLGQGPHLALVMKSGQTRVLRIAAKNKPD